MRDMSVVDLLAAQGKIARSLARFAETTPPFMPVVEQPCSGGDLISRVAAAAAGMDILVGATREEVHAFFAADPAMAAPEAVLAAEKLGDGALAYRDRRPGGTLMDWLADKGSDETFIWPSMRLASALTGPVFAYLFDYAPAASPFKACHCIELPFVFGTSAAFAGAGMLEGADPGLCAALSARLRRAWTGFIRDGVPGPDWPRYDAQNRLTMRLGEICEVARDPAGLTTRAGEMA
jgi:para-nitrobenzyl esterase